MHYFINYDPNTGIQIATVKKTPTPDASLHNPDPAYLRGLLDRAGLTQHAAAGQLGVSVRMMRYYLAPDAADHRDAPYTVQYALECLAESFSGVDSQAATRTMAP